MKRGHKLAALAGIGVIVLAIGPVLRFVDRWIVAPAGPPRNVELDCRIDAQMSAEGALGIGEHSLPGSDGTILVSGKWLDDDRLYVVVQRRNKEYQTQVELWLSFRPPTVPVARARAGSMQIGDDYTWPLIHPRGSVVFSSEGESFARSSDTEFIILEYHLEGHASGSPVETEQRIVVANADLR